MGEKATGDPLAGFSAATRAWFTSTFTAPTAAQDGAWRAAAEHQHSLVIAPTGSGKTLAAFLWALDHLLTTARPSDPAYRCRVLYVSPIKALAVDVQRNLRAPLDGIAEHAELLGTPSREIGVGIRTGDTPASQRRAFRTNPPDILVTTPESLFLLLTSNARENLRGVDTVIVDEVHAVAGTKRGAHLALSLERLEHLRHSGANDQAPARRIGLSATVRPVDEVSTFLTGGRPVRVVDPPAGKSVDLTVEVPVTDMTTLDEHTRSIWPAVERRIFDLITQHRSTIVFANSRRVAERLTARLNELHQERTGWPEGQRIPAEAIGQSGLTAGTAEQTIARSHHGSMAREQRTAVETQLKSGELPCVVATSSLELGIDMGAVDLVVQVEAPPTVASGLQRVGRAGHHVGAASSGVVFPRFRGDLVPCAVVAERMAAGAIESLHYPRNPLDVLAQQIVAMVAEREWTVEELARVVRAAAPFHELPDDALHAVLDMLAGRYPSTEFADLRPRITWDRARGTLLGRPGAQRLAVTSGGTIPDRGLYSVRTPDPASGRGNKVGELDEEMVYESRVGDRILLGTTSWRITDITHDRVEVVPAPGESARMPFWKGDAPARPRELGVALGAFVRELTALGGDDARGRLTRAGMDHWASENLLAYLAEQRAATGHVPDDHTVVIERFRDELGDWRVVVHSPFGARVNAPWALVIAAGLRDSRGLDAQVAHSDDGIVLRLPDTESYSPDGTATATGLPASAQEVLLDPDTVEHTVTEEVSSSALFAARFRECATRSLLFPRRDPAKRMPLWQQRQRSSQLLDVASGYPRFPVVLEAMRECLQDVYDLPGLRELMRDIAARRTRVIEVDTAGPSPFARSLLFDYVATFLYNTDTPIAERKAAALALDTSLLGELVGGESLRDLLDPDIIDEIEESLQSLHPDRHARDAEGAADLLRVLGDLTEGEAAARGVEPVWLAELERAHRAIRVRIAGQERYLAVEDAGRVHQALGAVLPSDVPEVFLDAGQQPLHELLARHARRRGPFTAAEVAARFGLEQGTARAALDELAHTAQLVRGELRPTRTGEAGPATGEPDYCDAAILRRIRRACLARARAEVEPVDTTALARFLPAWHGVTSTARAPHTTPGSDDVLACVEQLAGAPIPASALETLVLPARLPGYSERTLDELTASGEVVWTGCGSLPGSDGWVALAPADLADLLLPDAADAAPDSPVHAAVVSTLDGGAQFFRQLVDGVRGRGCATASEDEIAAALWDLTWAGQVTSDSVAPLRARLEGRGTTHKARSARPRGRYARLRAGRVAPGHASQPATSGRWALVPSRSADTTRRAHARTEAFLERHGVLTRGALEAEGTVGGLAAIYPVLREMEDAGHVIRGYIVDGLGAAQFAARGAADRLRGFAGPRSPGRPAEAIVLAAADPAQPYGAALPWPEPAGVTGHRPARKAGSLTVQVDGELVLYIERGGRSVLTFTTSEHAVRTAASALADAVRSGMLGTLSVRQVDGAYALTSPLAAAFHEAGFRTTPQGLRLRRP
ncbi:ATP dependent helicase, Lhr family [Haloechinothrix alba]|uniref:ATP dependent helicase, Lhr family n=1 Tax=Haloechinothrix alba TaxID=664784 RepID=A0A238X720_9PSEU|nr:ATP-dependent helicase [Haloechinothrix alba]SNR53639.1 ATP dependent helicase, Lhr family [Haloechinothrix alba]